MGPGEGGQHRGTGNHAEEERLLEEENYNNSSEHGVKLGAATATAVDMNQAQPICLRITCQFACSTGHWSISVQADQQWMRHLQPVCIVFCMCASSVRKEEKHSEQRSRGKQVLLVRVEETSMLRCRGPVHDDDGHLTDQSAR